MYAWNDKSWTNAHAALGHDATLSDVDHGMLAGTRVATAMGWRRVEAICEGDQVLTFDGGLQTVVAVRRQVIFAGETAAAIEDWPMLVPAGALGNREEMRIPARQAVLIESDTAEDVFGDPFALIPVASLEGFRGITPSRPADRIEIVTLHFAGDEIVFANTGALFYCPKATDILSDLFDKGEPSYSVLSQEQADLLVSFLELESETYGSVVPTCAQLAA